MSDIGGADADATFDPDDRDDLGIATNDAVGGETVDPERGDGTDNGPTGGAPREDEPVEWEHDEERVDLGDDLGNPLL
jgi:hypothetical protein